MADGKLKGLMGDKKRRKEALRMEKEMLSSFRSSSAEKRLRMKGKLLAVSENDPEIILMVLLINYDHPDPRIANCVKEALMALIDRRSGLDAMLEIIIHPDQDVRKNAFKFLSENGLTHSATYISFLEQTLVLMAIARRKGIPVNDIMLLVDVSRETYLDGRMMSAIGDIAISLDLIKHRIRSVEHLKNYLIEVLKLAPQLNRMGVYPGSIEEPLKRAIKASKNRIYDETWSIVEKRKQESRIRAELMKIGKVLSRTIDERPRMAPSEMSGTDVWLVTAVQELMNVVTSYTISGRENMALETLAVFLDEDFKEFYRDEMSDRVKERDLSGVFGLYTVGIVSLKLSAPMMMEASENIYQEYFRRFEGDPSIHIVRWPEIVMRILTSD